MRLSPATILPLLSIAFAPIARAGTPVVDGRLDAEYGTPLSLQTTQTSADDARGSHDASNGWELDAAYAVIRDGVLYLFFTGNVQMEPNPIQPGLYTNDLHVFLDVGPGGEHALRATTCGYCPREWIGGLAFDADFAPDYWIGLEGAGGPDFAVPYALKGWRGALPTTDPDTTTFLGTTATVSSGTFAQGDNPHGIRAALDNSNLGGVGQGCGSGSGAGATTGIELAVPLTAIGGATASLRVCAFLAAVGGYVENQVLAPAPAGACHLGAASALDFAAIAGPQFFTVLPSDPSAVPLPGPRTLRIAAVRGPGLTARIDLPSSAPARIVVVDAAGRRVLARDVEAAAGPHTMSLAAPGVLPGGVYFLRLAQGEATAVGRAVVIP